MHKELWQKLVDSDPCVTAQRTACAYDHGHRSFIVPLIQEDYEVNLEKRTIHRLGQENVSGDATYLEQLCILSYLIRACDMPLADKLVKPEQLEAGQFFFRGHHVLPTQDLLDGFGDHPDALRQAGIALQAKTIPYGDVSIELRVLPRFPVTFVVWGGDDEFAARASILFDETAAHQLPLDAIQVVVGLAVKALINAVSPETEKNVRSARG